MKNIITMLLCFVLLICCAENDKESKEVKEPVQKEKTPEVKKVVEEETKIETVKVDEKIIPTEKQKITEEKTDGNLWAAYNAAKAAAEEAKEDGDIETAIKELLRAANYAKKLNRPEIAAWQLNNIGYYSIQKFREVTDYDNRMAKLNSMKPGKQKEEYLNETMSLLKRNKSLLTSAKPHLKEAQEIDNKLEESNRTEVIKSNLEFIKWVENFLSNNTQPSEQELE
jgi:hypothetical protein